MRINRLTLRAAAATAALLLAASCAQEELDNYVPEKTGRTVTYTATIGSDDADTKAALGTNENGKPQTVWSAGDKITVHNGEQGFEFETDAAEGSASAEFSYTGDDFSAENGVIAVYPSGEYTADLAAKTVNVTVPEVQTAVAGSYDPAAAVAVAYSADDHLRFMNATALLKFTVATENIWSIVFEGLNDEAVGGNTAVVMAEDGSGIESLTCTAETGCTSVEIVAEDGFQLGTTYYMAIVPQKFEKGFKFSVRFVEDGPLHVAKNHAQAREIGRNVILNVGTLEFDIYSGLAADAETVLKSFQFDVAANPGKILPGQVKNGTKYNATARTFEKCDIKDGVVSAMIPYLNNRKLKPTFTVNEGTRLVYEGGIIESGKTMVDFLKYKEIKVINGSKEETVYTVELTNTGLPVVVVNQKTATVDTYVSGSDGNGYRDWLSWTGTKWQPKDSDWEMTEGVDDFMVYNADGSSAVTDKKGNVVDEPILASTRVRGNVSQKMPKKPFAVKLDSKSGVLGMPPHKRWVLLANWSDRTLMRNAIAFETARYFQDNLSDGLAWNPSGQFVELVYNGVHVGNYYLCEQIKIDDNRLAINDPYELPKPGKPDEYNGIPESYGYLLECDDAYDETLKFTTKHYIPFMFKDDGNQAMLSYAQELVCGIEDNLCAGNYSAAYQTLDMTSVVDYLLINEVMMNGELWHPKSAYMYINDGKLYAGPIWDFDWETIPNIDKLNSSYDDSYTSEDYVFTYDASMIAAAVSTRYVFGIPMGTTNYLYHSTASALPSAPLDGDDRNFLWYPMLVKDTDFKDTAASRWSSISAGLLSHIQTFIDETAEKIAVSEALNWDMWKLGTSTSSRWSTYNVGGGWKGDEQETFDSAVELLKTNYGERVTGMDGFVSGKNWPNHSYQNK